MASTVANSTTSDTAPTTWPRPTRADGKRNPPALVAMVVARKRAVIPAGVREAKRARTTETPDIKAIRLKRTCVAVKAATDNPRITTLLPRWGRSALLGD